MISVVCSFLLCLWICREWWGSSVHMTSSWSCCLCLLKVKGDGQGVRMDKNGTVQMQWENWIGSAIAFTTLPLSIYVSVSSSDVTTQRSGECCQPTMLPAIGLNCKEFFHTTALVQWSQTTTWYFTYNNGIETRCPAEESNSLCRWWSSYGSSSGLLYSALPHIRVQHLMSSVGTLLEMAAQPLCFLEGAVSQPTEVNDQALLVYHNSLQQHRSGVRTDLVFLYDSVHIPEFWTWA